MPRALLIIACRQPVHLPILPHVRTAYDPRTQTLYENLDAQTGAKVILLIPVVPAQQR